MIKLERKDRRKLYRIKPAIKFEVDNRNYLFSFLPTILWQPWRYRYTDSYVIAIHWLIFAIGVGYWEVKKGAIND